MALASIRGRLAPLNTSNLRSYWLNAVVSAFGDSVTAIALTLMVLRETGSLSLMATMSIVVILPGIVFGIVSATWVDRWDARRVTVVSQIVRALLILALVYVDLGHHLWIAFVIAGCQSFVGTFDDPARARLIRTITDDDTRLSVNSLTSSGKMIASMLGTTVGGGLAGSLDIFWPAFVVNSASFLLGAWAISRVQGDFAPVRSSGDADEEASRFRDDVLEGIRAVRQSPVLTAVVLAASAAMIGLSAATIMLTPLIVDELQAQPAWFGALEAAQSSSAILVALAVGVFGRSLDPKQLVAIGMVATGIVIGLMGIAMSILALLIIMFLVGITITPVNSGYSTLLQTYAPKETIGRVAAAMNTCIQTVSVASMAVAGVLGDALGVRPVFWMAGSICVVAGVLAGILFHGTSAPAGYDSTNA